MGLCDPISIQNGDCVPRSPSRNIQSRPLTLVEHRTHVNLRRERVHPFDLDLLALGCRLFYLAVKVEEGTLRDVSPSGINFCPAATSDAAPEYR